MKLTSRQLLEHGTWQVIPLPDNYVQSPDLSVYPPSWTPRPAIEIVILIWVRHVFILVVIICHISNLGREHLVGMFAATNHFSIFILKRAVDYCYRTDKTSFCACKFGGVVEGVTGGEGRTRIEKLVDSWVFPYVLQVFLFYLFFFFFSRVCNSLTI